MVAAVLVGPAYLRCAGDARGVLACVRGEVAEKFELKRPIVHEGEAIPAVVMEPARVQVALDEALPEVLPAPVDVAALPRAPQVAPEVAGEPAGAPETSAPVEGVVPAAEIDTAIREGLEAADADATGATATTLSEAVSPAAVTPVLSDEAEVTAAPDLEVSAAEPLAGQAPIAPAAPGDARDAVPAAQTEVTAPSPSPIAAQPDPSPQTVVALSPEQVEDQRPDALESVSGPVLDTSIAPSPKDEVTEADTNPAATTALPPASPSAPADSLPKPPRPRPALSGPAVSMVGLGSGSSFVTLPPFRPSQSSIQVLAVPTRGQGPGPGSFQTLPAVRLEIEMLGTSRR